MKWLVGSLFFAAVLIVAFEGLIYLGVKEHSAAICALWWAASMLGSALDKMITAGLK